MNLSTRDVNGGLLLVSQFTLVADTHSGTRPSFSTAMASDESKKIFEFLVKKAAATHSPFATGEFGAHMQISLCNDGPVTFMLKV
jgi:D-tyrosyl-tRNA(Tyr) deacylase